MQTDMFQDDSSLQGEVVDILGDYWVSEDAQYNVFEKIKQAFLKAGYTKNV